jgi:restriction system protein
MALWMVRAGSYGEYENKYLKDNRIYCTWDGFNHNLNNIDSILNLREIMQNKYEYKKKGQLISSSAQVWSFAKSIKKDDWIVLPSKKKAAIHFAKVISDYKYDITAEDPFFHYRDVEWFVTDIPRTNFSQDILYSLGAFRTICQIKRNNAELRIRQMAKNKWQPEKIPISEIETTDIEEDIEVDIEVMSRDKIAANIIAKFQGHGMTRLVESILRAQGYTTYISPEGPDKGIDILAGSGSIGFDHPRICVQVKSGDIPIDRPILDQLIGTMQKVNADHGLLVSWSGYKQSIDKEKAQQFFRVRLWDQQELIDNILLNYDKIDDDIKAELPLKRIWVISSVKE